MVQDVNEFAPKWNIRSEDIANEPLHTLTTGVSIEEGQLFEEVSASVCNVYCVNILVPKLTIFLLEMEWFSKEKKSLFDDFSKWRVLKFVSELEKANTAKTNFLEKLY